MKRVVFKKFVSVILVLPIIISSCFVNVDAYQEGKNDVVYNNWGWKCIFLNLQLM